MIPRGVANLDPRDMVGRIYVGDPKHCYILNLLALGLMVSENKIFEGSLAQHKHDPLGCGQFGPQGLDWQDLCRGPLNIATY